MKKIVELLSISNKQCYPIIEGGKGIGITNGITAGNFAKNNCVGTFSGVNADYYDENGNIVHIKYRGKTRRERHEELISYGIKGAIAQSKIANDISQGNGRIHMNVLWEMGGAERILEGVLKKTKGLIHGITCGAGMPYKLSQIASKYQIYYYPIVSSARALRALWKRSYRKCKELLGGIVYECPWKAGGHNGLSNSESPDNFIEPYSRIVEIRSFMNEVGLSDIPIIMAGGVWNLEEYKDWIEDKRIGKIVFQFGTRPVVTQEYPVSLEWKKILLNLKKNEVYLNRFSPTGFYSSAINNSFIKELKERNDRQITYSTKLVDHFTYKLPIGQRNRSIFIEDSNKTKVNDWLKQGFDQMLKTPDNTVVFVTANTANKILKDQIECMGCLSQCRFSNWSQKESNKFTTGIKSDPRSFCIQKTLQEAKVGHDLENQLMFAGHNAYRFSDDQLYKNGYIPSIKELLDNILIGK